MGTNYYLSEKPPCECCGREFPQKHIGKSSAGWCFALHVDPDNGISDLDDWERLWAQPGATITDEYGKAVTVEEMRLIIMARNRPEPWGKKPLMYESWQQFHEQNHSTQGPFELLRHAIGRHCLKNGAGTWDCVPGEFS